MTLRQALRAHWAEYGMEAAGLAAFMLAACVFTVLRRAGCAKLDHAPGVRCLRSKHRPGCATV